MATLPPKLPAHHRKRVVLVGPLPPPVNGMSTGFSVLATGLPEATWHSQIIDIADRSSGRRGGAFLLSRALGIVAAFVRLCFAVPRSSLVYVTIAQSRNGFFRDLLVSLPALVFGKPLIFHLHGGNYRAFFESQPQGIRALVRWLVGRARCIVVLAESFRSDFDLLAGGREKTVVIP